MRVKFTFKFKLLPTCFLKYSKIAKFVSWKVSVLYSVRVVRFQGRNIRMLTSILFPVSTQREFDAPFLLPLFKLKFTSLRFVSFKSFIAKGRSAECSQYAKKPVFKFSAALKTKNENLSFTRLREASPCANILYLILSQPVSCITIMELPNHHGPPETLSTSSACPWKRQWILYDPVTCVSFNLKYIKT